MRPSTSQPNPILAFLDASDLPWRLPHAQLIARYGIRTHPASGSKGTFLLSERPLIDGLMGALHAGHDEDFERSLPAIRFNGHVHVGADARDNLRLAVAQFDPHLDRGVSTDVLNRLQHRWEFGASSVSLTLARRLLGSIGAHSFRA